jgi:hypothetical protein
MFCSIMRGNHAGDLIKAVCFGEYSTLVVETAITVFHSNTTNLGCLLDLVTEETLVESWFCLHIPSYQEFQGSDPASHHYSQLPKFIQVPIDPNKAPLDKAETTYSRSTTTTESDSASRLFTAYQDRLRLPQRRHHVDQVRPPQSNPPIIPHSPHCC